jgi:hypothetical protein
MGGHTAAHHTRSDKSNLFHGYSSITRTRFFLKVTDTIFFSEESEKE